MSSILESIGTTAADIAALVNVADILTSLLAGAIGGLMTLLLAWHRLHRQHKSLQRGQDETVVNFSIEAFEPIEQGYRLRILSLEPEMSIEDFVDNPALLKSLGRAVRQTTVADPLVRFEDPHLAEALSRTIVNHVGGCFGWLNAFAVAGAVGPVALVVLNLPAVFTQTGNDQGVV